MRNEPDHSQTSTKASSVYQPNLEVIFLDISISDGNM